MFVRTPRLLLRPGWIEDAPALATAIGEEAIVRNLATAPYPYGIDDARSFLALAEDARLPRLLAFARTRGVPRLIGGCGLHRDGQGDVELGYWIGRAHWGLGYATEAARAMLEFAFGVVKARWVTAVTDRRNIPSVALAKRLGFVEVQAPHAGATPADAVFLLARGAHEAAVALEGEPLHRAAPDRGTRHR